MDCRFPEEENRERSVRRVERDPLQRAIYEASGEPLGTDASGCARKGFVLWCRFRTYVTTN